MLCFFGFFVCLFVSFLIENPNYVVCSCNQLRNSLLCMILQGKCWKETQIVKVNKLSTCSYTIGQFNFLERY